MVASSDESMQVLEIFQVQAKEGPSFDCYRSGLPVVRLSREEASHRWPEFVPQALVLGYKSIHCLPLRLRLRLRNETIGALNLFRTNRGEMDAEDVLLAEGLADIAAIGILQHRAAGEASALNGQLTTALGSRIVIEQVKGIVSQSEECSVEVVFGRIRAHSRNHNERLTEVAVRIVGGHLLPSAMDSVGSSS